jgi:prolyl-tRNA synthetase
VDLPPPLHEPASVETPGMTTVEAVSRALEVPQGALLKSFPVINNEKMKLVVVRGDHRVNEHKLRAALKSDFRPAHPDEIAQRLGPPGFIGPVGAEVPILLDAAVVPGGNSPGGYVTGSNQPDAHLRGVEPGRDFRFDPVDVRTVVAGDTVNGSAIRIEPAIEVGNIFKLGTRYSEPLDATYLDETGAERLIWMGSYGFGPARASAAAVEQYADEHGISWPRAIAPFDLELVVLGKPGGEERELAERLYAQLRDAGLDVLYDDRDAGPGEKFADAELLGCPARVTVGRRTLAEGTVEVQVRRGRESRVVPIDGAAEAVARLWQELP